MQTVEELINWGTSNRKEYFLDRLIALKEEEYINIEALTEMFIFLNLFNSFSKPDSLTISEAGFLYLEYKRNSDYLLLMFKDTDSQYLVYEPSNQNSKYSYGSFTINELTEENPLYPLFNKFISD